MIQSSRVFPQIDFLLPILNYFVPASLKQNVTKQTSAQILVGIITFSLVVAGLTDILIHATVGLNHYSSLISDSLIASLSFVFVASLIVLCVKGNLSLAGNLTAFGVFATVFISVMITGGFRDSPFSQLFALVPVMVFLLVGLRYGIIWSLLTLVAIFSMIVSDQASDFHVQILDEGNLAALRRILPIVMVTMITIALLIYELINGHLKRQLNYERNRFEFRASHDVLTDLPNRAEFYQRLQHGLQDIFVTETSLAVVYIDLDGFKPINDNFGHHAGDTVLKVLSARLRNMVRQHDTVARLGGDEFALILTGVKRIADVEIIITKMLGIISQPIDIGGNQVVVHGSVGIAMSPQDGSDSDTLCKLADKAMYSAKETKNTFRFYSGINRV